MNKDERVMSKRMVRDAEIQGYLLADGNYDSNPLHEVCSEHGELQLITPLRGGFGRKHDDEHRVLDGEDPSNFWRILTRNSAAGYSNNATRSNECLEI